MRPATLKYLRIAVQALSVFVLLVLASGAFCSFYLGKSVPTPWYFVCPLGALQQLVASRTVLVVMGYGLVLVVLSVLLGRVFCGWVCPVGALVDLVRGLSDRVRGRKRTEAAGGLVARPENRYAVLAGAVLGAGLLRYPAFCAVCPVGTTCRTLGLEQVHLAAEAAVIPAVAGLELARPRFWCRYLCPLGALLTLVGSRALLRIRLPLRECVGCGRCTVSCPHGLDPLQETRHGWERDPQVVRALLASPLPDLLRRPVPRASLPVSLLRVLEKRSRAYELRRPQCTRCYDCAAACPVLNARRGG